MINLVYHESQATDCNGLNNTTISPKYKIKDFLFQTYSSGNISRFKIDRIEIITNIVSYNDSQEVETSIYYYNHFGSKAEEKDLHFTVEKAFEESRRKLMLETEQRIADLAKKFEIDFPGLSFDKYLNKKK